MSISAPGYMAVIIDFSRLVLAGCQADPSGDRAELLKVGRFLNGGDERGRSDHAGAGDRHEGATGLALTNIRDQLTPELGGANANSRFSLVLDPRFSYRGEDVVPTLERVCSRTGYPKTIRVDQGSEFISRDLDLWAYQRGVTFDFSRPGKPTYNAFIEAFNGRLRDECLSAHWFLSLADAAEKLEAWRRDYNEQRPHGAIGNKVPAALMKSAHATSPCCQ